MYGVVLWSDRTKNCAVIWCEDHRKLAYFQDDTRALSDNLPFGPGDLIEFSVREHGDLRWALDPCLVSERQYDSLADDLLDACFPPPSRTAPRISMPDHVQEGGDVLHFPMHRVARSEKTLETA